MANQVLARLPALDLDIIGWENDASVFGGVTLSLPAFSVDTGNLSTTALELPELQLSVAGFAGIVDTDTALGITPVLSITGSPGVYGSAHLTLPTPTLQVYSQNQAALVLPTVSLAINAYTGAVGAVVLQEPRIALSVSGQVPFTAVTSLSVTPRLAVAGVVGAGAQLNASLRALALAADGYTGTVGGVSVELPVYQLGSGGSGALIGQASLTLPMLVLQATGSQRVLVPGVNASTAVLHTETQALTEYDNYPFNSFARFNGVYLGAKDDGIFVLSGADDAGVAIDAYARVGITDMGTSRLKRVDRCYVGYRADGEMVLRVTTEGSEVRDYKLRSTGYGDIHTNMVKLGRGLEARYWQFELRNQDGADFQLDTMEILPITLRRRLWGKP